MSKRLTALIATLCGCLLLTFAAGDARADRRIALVVGNSNYGNPSLVLSNPKNDAEDVAAALRSLGFEVVQALDANKRDMDISMAKFARLATDSDAALFYYAGHALQYQGRNYLMPTDAEVEDEVSLRYQMMPIDDVRAALDRASGVKVMILDACRNNPVADTLRKKMSGETRAIGSTRGLARIDKTQGTVIAYSTAADEVANDGQGRNSPFTTAFLKRLNEPGLEIEQLFRRVAADVNSATGGRQRPETYVSLLSDYYLNQTDRTAYDTVKDTADASALRNFIDRFPTSSFAADARYRIQRIDIEAQEKQLQQARQQEAARILEQQNKTDPDAGRTRIARAETPNAGQNQPAAAARPDGTTRLVGVERQDLNSQSLLNTAPAAPGPKAAVAPPPASSSNKSCDQDSARLAQLRSGASLSDVVQFESEMGCDRLRPQVARLRESLGGGGLTPAAPAMGAAKPVVAALPPPPAAAPIAIPNPAPLSRLDTPTPPRAPVAGTDQTPACKQDEARLSRLRSSPSFAEVTAFERELGCEKLRPQIVRLRESLAPAGNPDRSVTLISPATPDQEPAPQQAPAEQPAPVQQQIPVPQIAALPSPDAIPARPAPSDGEIAQSIKSELSRVGCLTGSTDGEWNAASRRSLDLFNRYAGTRLDSDHASLDALDAIRLKPTRVCPLVCAHGFKADGDRCSRIACADGSVLNDDNECEKVRARTPTARRNTEDRPERVVRERPAPEPRIVRPQASGQMFCDNGGCRAVDRGCRPGPTGPDGIQHQICN